MRIPTLLQKIAELAEHPDRRTRIDVDLMLDYTRVLYADLLEWRDKLSAPAPNPVSAAIPAVTRSTGPAPGPTSTVSDTEPNVPRGAQSTAMPDNRFIAQRRDSLSPRPDASPVSKPVPSPVSNPEKVPVEATPSPAPKIPEIIEPTLAELAASMDRESEAEKNFRPIRPQAAQAAASNLSIPASAPKVEQTSPTTAAAAKIPLPPKDIRSNISINEKYQIMSELFGNDKTAYENALDKINAADSENAAIKWLQDQLWVTEERSDAVQQFFDLVKRFKSQPEQGFLRFSE